MVNLVLQAVSDSKKYTMDSCGVLFTSATRLRRRWGPAPENAAAAGFWTAVPPEINGS
jgi:hypothetical protein